MAASSGDGFSLFLQRGFQWRWCNSTGLAHRLTSLSSVSGRMPCTWRILFSAALKCCFYPEAGSHSLLQGIFPTQGLNLNLLNCRQILYCLSQIWRAAPIYIPTNSGLDFPFSPHSPQHGISCLFSNDHPNRCEVMSYYSFYLQLHNT